MCKYVRYVCDDACVSICNGDIGFILQGGGTRSLDYGLFCATGGYLRMSCMRARKQVSPSVRKPGQWERTGVTNYTESAIMAVTTPLGKRTPFAKPSRQHGRWGGGSGVLLILCVLRGRNPMYKNMIRKAGSPWRGRECASSVRTPCVQDVLLRLQ